MSKHALIGGGTGFIGRHLVKHLQKNGYNTTIISRMPGVNHMSWQDLEKKGIGKDVTAVVNLAGQNVLDPTRRWTDGFRQNVWNSRINTTAALVKAISDAPDVSVFVNISGVSNYRPNEKTIYTEHDHVEGYDFMSKLCMEWEKAATLPQGTSRCVRMIRVRTGVVVGHDGGMIQSMWLPFKLGLGGPMGNGKQILPWIHIEDLCRLIHHAIDNENCRGVLNGVAPEVITNEEFSKAFASALHRPCVFSIPESVVHLLFGAERSTLLLTGAKIQPKYTLATGFKFKYPSAKAACEQVVNKS